MRHRRHRHRLGALVGIAGLAAAIVGLALSIPALRRSGPTGRRRGAAIAGLVTSAVGIALGVVGIVFTVYLVGAIERFDDPGPYEASITSCEEEGTDVVANRELTNQSDRQRDYSVLVRLGPGGRDWVTVEDVAAGATAGFTACDSGSFSDGACRVDEVRGPVPFGLNPSISRSDGGSAPGRRRLHPGVVQPGIGAAGRDELVVRTVLDEAAVGEHEHAVGAGRGREAVGDRDRRAALGEWLRAREMRTSVRASTDEVASSSTNTSGSATPARSRATSCRSPADS